jgi:membrane protein YdbS with pleckstrin-like domain
VKPDLDDAETRSPAEGEAPPETGEPPRSNGGEGPTADGVEVPALSGAEGPVLRAVEGPALSPVEGIADGIERRLDPRVIQLDRAIGWIVTAVISFGLFVAGASTLIAASSWPAWAMAAVAAIWFGGTAGLGWWLQVWPAISYRYASYIVDASGMEIREGVVWRTVTNVPRSRVQHTDVSQGPLERRFGIATLVIHTAGTDAAVVSVHGLTHETALAIRDHLLPREGPDAV